MFNKGGFKPGRKSGTPLSPVRGTGLAEKSRGTLKTIRKKRNFPLNFTN